MLSHVVKMILEDERSYRQFWICETEPMLKALILHVMYWHKNNHLEVPTLGDIYQFIVARDNKLELLVDLATYRHIDNNRQHPFIQSNACRILKGYNRHVVESLFDFIGCILYKFNRKEVEKWQKK